MAAKQTILITEVDLSQLITAAVKQAIKEYQAESKPDNTLLTQRQAAELLKVSIPTLIKWKNANLLPYSQVNRKIYFRKNDLLNALETLVNKGAKG